MEKPIYVGFATLELSKLHMYESFYDKLQPYFGEKSIQCFYINTDAFVVLSTISKVFFKDLKDLEDFFDFSNSSENGELFSNINKK